MTNKDPFHVEERAKKIALMGNIHRPKSSKRILLESVMVSIAVYATPIWRRSLDMSKPLLKLDNLQRRRMTLGMCSGYRSISTRAVTVETLGFGRGQTVTLVLTRNTLQDLGKKGSRILQMEPGHGLSS